MMFGRRRRAPATSVPPAPDPIRLVDGLAEELARTGRTGDAFEFARQLDDFVYNALNGWILQRRLGPVEAIAPNGLVLLYDVARLPEGGWYPLPEQGGIAPPLQYQRRQHRLFLRWVADRPSAARAVPAVPTPRTPLPEPDPEPTVRTTALPLVTGSAVAVALTAGGPRVACTTTVDGDEQVVAVVDLAADGFGDHLGRSLFALGSGDSTVTALSGSADGATTAGGAVAPRSGGPASRGVVARLTATGLLDRGFGDRGIVTLGVEHPQVVDVLAVRTGATLVLTRLAAGPDRQGAALMLLDGAGAPVTAFGQGEGVVTLVPPSGCVLSLNVLAHDPTTGRTYAGGSLAEPGSPQRPVVVAFSEHGGFVPDFAEDGMLTTVFAERPGTVAGLTVVPCSTGHDLIAVGAAAAGPDGRGAPALSRCDARGRMRPGFAAGGVRVLRPPGPARLVGAVARPDGGVRAVGTAGRGTEQRMIVAEFDADGRPSPDAGPAGCRMVGTGGLDVAAVAGDAAGTVAAATLATPGGPVPHVVTIA